MDFRGEMIKSFIIKLSDGNIGALTCCTQLLDTNEKAITALQRAYEMGLKGDKLYLIWNDCCNRDANKTIEVLHEKSKEELWDHIDVLNHDYRCVPFQEINHGARQNI